MVASQRSSPGMTSGARDRSRPPVPLALTRPAPTRYAAPVPPPEASGRGRTVSRVMTEILVPMVTLAPGVQLPQVGFGVFRVPPAAAVRTP